MTTRYMDPVPQSRRSLPALAVFGAMSLVSWLTGCSVLVDANRKQCTQNSDCTNRGAESANSVCTAAGFCDDSQVPVQWACEALTTSQSPSYKLTMHIQDAVTSKALPGVVAQLCRKLDVTCAGPIGSSVVADANGGVAMQIDAGFDGYVQLTDPNIAPALYFLTPPTSGDLDLPTVPLASPFSANQIVRTAGGSGTTWSMDRGIVLLNAFDCQHQAAADITYSIGGTPDPASFIFYLVNGLPTTANAFTDSTGYGGLVNVAPGSTTITATLVSSGRKVSKVSVLVREGYVTYSSVTPNSL